MKKKIVLILLLIFAAALVIIAFGGCHNECPKPEHKAVVTFKNGQTAVVAYRSYYANLDFKNGSLYTMADQIIADDVIAYKILY